jgi:hypothetical protein
LATQQTEPLKFIINPYTVIRTVCFMFSRGFADGETAAAYYRLEVVQPFGADWYSALLRETDRPGNILARRGEFSERKWGNPDEVVLDVLAWCNGQEWVYGKWADEDSAGE